MLNASSAARMVLTTETVVVDKPAKAEDHDHHHGHAHYQQTCSLTRRAQFSARSA